MISYSIFFNQNKVPFKPEEVGEMDIDDLLITYELLVSQVDEERKQIEDASKQRKP